MTYTTDMCSDLKGEGHQDTLFKSPLVGGGGQGHIVAEPLQAEHLVLLVMRLGDAVVRLLQDAGTTAGGPCFPATDQGKLFPVSVTGQNNLVRA